MKRDTFHRNAFCMWTKFSCNVCQKNRAEEEQQPCVAIYFFDGTRKHVMAEKVLVVSKNPECIGSFGVLESLTSKLLCYYSLGEEWWHIASKIRMNYN